MNKDDYEIKVYAQVNADMAEYPDLPDELLYLKNMCTAGEMTSTFLAQANLKKEGDISERLRHVRHFAYFASRKAAHRLARKAHEMGYIDVFVMPVKNKRWRVDFCHIGAGTFLHIIHWECAVRKIVVDAGGEYDGWESPVMRKDDPNAVLLGYARELVERVSDSSPQLLAA